MGPFETQLNAFKDHTQDETHELVREVIVETGRRLIDRSPVLTGQFADNWNYGLETRDTRTHGPTGARAINNLAEIPATPAGFFHFLSNALPYGPSLERGSSRQAPQGMVGLTVLEWPQIVAAAARKVGP